MKALLASGNLIAKGMSLSVTKSFKSIGSILYDPSAYFNSHICFFGGA